MIRISVPFHWSVPTRREEIEWQYMYSIRTATVVTYTDTLTDGGVGEILAVLVEYMYTVLPQLL